VGGDARAYLGFLAPIVIVYMTYSSISAAMPPVRGVESKSVSVSQTPMPKLPSAERELRNPFVPEGAAQALAAAAGAKAGAKEREEAMRLDGTVLAGKLRFAIINGTRVMEGDYFRGLKLTVVETSQVRFSDGKQESVLPLAITKSDAIKPMEPVAVDAKATRSVAGDKDKAARNKPTTKPDAKSGLLVSKTDSRSMGNTRR
jgi:hypothetical protein